MEATQPTMDLEDEEVPSLITSPMSSSDQDAALKKTPPPSPSTADSLSNTSRSQHQRSPVTEIGLSKTRREMTPQHLLKHFTRVSTPEEYVSPSNIISGASLKVLSSSANPNSNASTRVDDPFNPIGVSPPSFSSPTSHIPIMKSRRQSSSNHSTSMRVAVSGTSAHSQIQHPSALLLLNKGTEENEHDDTLAKGIGGMVSPAVDDDDILASAQPRTSIPQPTDHPVPGHQSMLAEGNSGGYYPSQSRPLFDFSTIVADDGGEGIYDNHEDGNTNLLDDVAVRTIGENRSSTSSSSKSLQLYSKIPSPPKNQASEQEALDSLRKKLGSVLTKRLPTPHKSSGINTQDVADEIYLEVREALKDLKQVIRDIKRKQEMAMIETETVKDGLYDLVSARKQLEEVQTSMDDVQEAIKLAEMEFASHRKTLEDRRKEDDELELKVQEMDKETLRLAQIIDDRRKEQQELQSQIPPPLVIRVVRELGEIGSRLTSFLGLLVLFLCAEIMFVYILMLSRSEELESRLGYKSGQVRKDTDSHGVWVVPLVKSILDGAATLFFSESRDVTPI
ncbi:hypothetical protein SeLEV6574_g01238 [Synchytrium endobioticum]|uniref:Uncharacterized protein n=1 Tax=Synchytrium endobioticum TaxID=286115 RepID=A0A507DEK4_9FUNG|nr:hypothetical protein SeLEV6574_g01238 [Synchytrium endobioticum]